MEALNAFKWQDGELEGLIKQICAPISEIFRVIYYAKCCGGGGEGGGVVVGEKVKKKKL